MIAQTIIVAFLFGVIALSRRSMGSALGVVVISMLLWPEYLRVPFGLAEMSVPRVVALFLLMQIMARGRFSGMNFGKVDVLVLTLWVWTVFATILADAVAAQTIQMIGRGLDTVLMYFVARIALRTADDVLGFCKGLMVSSMVMGVIGVVEAVTSYSPYSSLTGYMTWTFGFEKENEYRLGLLRAKASASTHIYFGMAMMVIFGMLWAVRGFSNRLLVYKTSVVASVLAALSSMSSGPWLGSILIILLNAFAQRISLIRPAVYLILLVFLALELLSNRHFYNLIDYLALDPQTAWYRTRLLEVALSQWRDFWIIGVGSNWPHHWAALVDGRGHIDVVNHFLIVALYGGIPAVVMYISTHVIAVRMTTRAWREDGDESRRKILFGMAVTLISLDISSMSVGLFGPVLLLSHVLLGSMVSVAVAWRGLDNGRMPLTGR